MPSFLVRVVLHATPPHEVPNYDLLHSAMNDAHFSRQIQGDNGIWYHLPAAEYVKTGNYTIQQVHNSATAAINTVGVHMGVLTSEVGNYQWLLIPV